MVIYQSRFDSLFSASKASQWFINKVNMPGHQDIKRYKSALAAINSYL